MRKDVQLLIDQLHGDDLEQLEKAVTVAGDYIMVTCVDFERKGNIPKYIDVNTGELRTISPLNHDELDKVSTSLISLLESDISIACLAASSLRYSGRIDALEGLSRLIDRLFMVDGFGTRQAVIAISSILFGMSDEDFSQYVGTESFGAVVRSLRSVLSDGVDDLSCIRDEAREALEIVGVRVHQAQSIDADMSPFSGLHEGRPGEG